MGYREIVILLITIFVWILTFRKPFWGLLYFLLFSTVTWQHIYSNLTPLHLIKITAIITLISWFYHRRVLNGKTIKAPQFYLMIGLFFIMVTSRLLAGVPIMGDPYGYYMEFWKKILLFLVIINIINTEERLNIFMRIMVIAYATLAFVARDIGWTKPYPWWDHNDFALGLVSVVPIVLFFIFSEKRLWNRLEAVPYALIIAFICLGSSSRGGFVGLIAVFLLSLIKKPVKRSRLIGILILIPIALFLYSRLNVKFIERYKTIENYPQQRTAQMRFTAWRVGIRMLEENPIIGVGTGMFSSRFSEYATDEEMEYMQGWSNAHSIYIQIAAENGLLGIGIFLLMVIFTFRDMLRLWLISKRDKDKSKICYMGIAVGIGLIGYLISGLFLNTGYRSGPYVLMALIVAAKEIAIKKAPEEKMVEEKVVEFPQFNILSRTALLGFCVYLGLY